MIRTQVYLPEDLNMELKLIAKQEGVNYSTLIREGVRIVINKRNKKRGKKLGVGFVGIIKGGPKDLSKKIDTYLYG